VADVVFIQRSRLGRSIFTLHDDAIHVLTRTFLGTSDLKFPLRSISPDYDLKAVRIPALIWLPLLFSGGCFRLFYVLVDRDWWPEYFALYPLMFAFIFGWAAFQGVARLEHFVFSSHTKMPLFSIYRERAQQAECDAFVRELLDRIERVTLGLAPAEVIAPPVSAVRLPSDEDDAPEVRSAGNRWIVALAAGLLSAVYPVYMYDLPGRLFYSIEVVVLASTAGLVATYLSFAAKERMKYWALAGAALCLVPLIFY
jgi:hypothetical protein